MLSHAVEHGIRRPSPHTFRVGMTTRSWQAKIEGFGRSSWSDEYLRERQPPVGQLIVTDVEESYRQTVQH